MCIMTEVPVKLYALTEEGSMDASTISTGGAGLGSRGPLAAKVEFRPMHTAGWRAKSAYLCQSRPKQNVSGVQTGLEGMPVPTLQSWQDENDKRTLSPTSVRVMPSPTAITVPDPSCPSMQG